MYNDLNDVKPQKKLVRFKTQLLLALIPFFGWAVAFFTTMHNFSVANKSHSKFFVYFFSTIIPTFLVFGIAGLLIYIIYTAVVDLQLMIALYFVVGFIMLLGVAYVFLGMEKIFLKDIKF